MGRVILHVDMDAFFASIHAREDPALAEVPVVVGADPQGGRGRGVVSTCNYRAREFGIRSAMPISEAYRRCPRAVFLKPRFDLYSAASHDVMSIMERYADQDAGVARLEVAGMDEAYLDVTRRVAGDFVVARNLARSLQAAIKRETGLSASVGIAASKSIAKIASDYRKPHGITVVPGQDAVAFLDPLPVRLINGCGPKTSARLAEWDIHTVGDLAGTDPALLTARFGSHGGWLHDIANGLDRREVVADRGPRKSRGNERTYGHDQADPTKVLGAGRKLLAGLLEGQDRRAFATITVKIRYSDFTTLTRAHTLSVPIQPGGPEARHLAMATMEGLLAPLCDGRPVRLVGVRVSGFQADTGQRALSHYGVAVQRSASTATSTSCLP